MSTISIPDRRQGLPVPLTSFIGRVREVADIAAMLSSPPIRLVTLTGPGGVGKTRLALQVAAELESVWAEDIVFLPLADIVDSTLLLPTIAHHLGVRDTGEAPIANRLADVLRDRHLLLVLDNFEQILDAAPFLADLLTACRHLTLLVTSRAALRISGEHEFVILPLDAMEASHLFADRARAVRQSFAVTVGNTKAIAELCSQFDRLPLAIEPAAARVKVLSPEAMLARLEHRLPFLIGGPINAPHRLQTMHGAIAWSHDLLSPVERTLFRHIGVFVGGFTLEAAEAVCIPVVTGRLDMLPSIASLVDKSLVQVGEHASTPRFTMLETIREFALERLREGADEVQVRERHAAYIRAFAESAGPELYGPNQQDWFDLIQDEHANIRAALAWSEQQQDADTFLAVGAALWPFWFTRSHLTEGRRWLERALALSITPGSRDWIETLHGLGALAHQLGDYQCTLSAGEELFATSHQLGNVWGVSRGQYMMSRAIGALGDNTYAIELAADAVSGFRELADNLWLAYSLNRLGVEVAASGDFVRAINCYEEALVLWRQVGNTAGVAMTSDALAEAARQIGDNPRAVLSARESLALYLELGDLVGMVEALVTVVAHGASTAQTEQTVRLLGAADAARESLGFALYAHHLAAFERVLPTLPARMGKRGFSTAWETGRRLPIEVAAAEALALVSSHPASGPQGEDSSSGGGRQLSPRERDVLALLVNGSSDQAIADALFISRRTAQGHVARILDKLDVPNRAAAAALAFRDDLLTGY